METVDDGNLRAAVHRAIRTCYPGAPDVLERGMRFGVELAGDSLSYVELVSVVEGILQENLPDGPTAAVRTVGEFEDLVLGMAAGGSASSDA